MATKAIPPSRFGRRRIKSQSSKRPPGVAEMTMKYDVALPPPISPSPFGTPYPVYRTPPAPARLAALRRQYSLWHKALRVSKRVRGAPPPVDEATSRAVPVPPAEILGTRAEPPEVSTTRPRPGNLSQGALGPRR